MDKFNKFNNWYMKNWKDLLAQKNSSQAGLYFIAQQSFFAGMESNEKQNNQKVANTKTKFEDLPITFDETEYSTEGWSRTIKRQGTILELLETWDIDDPKEDSAMAQVLRYLRSTFK